MPASKTTHSTRCSRSPAATHAWHSTGSRRLQRSRAKGPSPSRTWRTPCSSATCFTTARAPKSNSALASYGAARELIQETGNEPVPMHLRNAPTGLMKSMGYGRDYKYAHDYQGGVANQVHMPEKLKSRKVYTPNPRDRKPGK